MMVKCKVCGNEWDYKGKRYYAQCPMCMSMMKLPMLEKIKNKVKPIEVKQDGYLRCALCGRAMTSEELKDWQGRKVCVYCLKKDK